jgi:hypothetical protein
MSLPKEVEDKSGDVINSLETIATTPPAGTKENYCMLSKNYEFCIALNGRFK